MKVLKKLKKTELTKEFKTHRDFEWIEIALKRHKYCYQVLIDLDDFARLVINSSFTKPYATNPEYPLLKKVVTEILENPRYLDVKHPDRGISGVTVKKYLKEIKGGLEVNKAFISDKEPDMRKDGSYMVWDAMHRLVAFGVYTKMDSDKFPIPAILCTNQKLPS